MRTFSRVLASMLCSVLILPWPSLCVSAAQRTDDIEAFIYTKDRIVNIGDYNRLAIAKNDTYIYDENGKKIATFGKDGAADIVEDRNEKDMYSVVSGNIKGFVHADDILIDDMAELRAVDVIKDKREAKGEEFNYDLEIVPVDDSRKSFEITVDNNLDVAKAIVEERNKEIDKEIKKAEEKENKAKEVKEEKKRGYSDADLKLLSAIVYCESGNQPYEGKLAVANVIMNRVNSNKFPNSLKGVIYSRRQFTPARNGKLNRALQKGVPSHCTKVAKDALEGKNIVKGYYYFDNRIHKGGYKKIGQQYFWKTPW